MFLDVAVHLAKCTVHKSLFHPELLGYHSRSLTYIVLAHCDSVRVKSLPTTSDVLDRPCFNLKL